MQGRLARHLEQDVHHLSRSAVGNVMMCLKAITSLSSRVAMPAWLAEPKPFPADEVLAATNGLLHLSSPIKGKPSFEPLTPRFFSANVLDYDIDTEATCPEWTAFLSSVWPSDAESIDTLQEWFGYCLLPDTRHHKVLMLVGPRRSGKGTIGRVLASLVGSHNVCTPTLGSMAGPFGLWPLLDKTLAAIADARLSGRMAPVAVVERLLSISGEDPQDVHRKNLPTLTGLRLPVRFTLLTNELPNLRDASDASLSRVVLLQLTKSWLGREDKRLGEKLFDERSGILTWSIMGWRRFVERGYFVQPESGQELIDELESLTSPSPVSLATAAHSRAMAKRPWTICFPPGKSGVVQITAPPSGREKCLAGI